MVTDYDMKCNICGLRYTGIEGMQRGYECCNPESIEHLQVKEK